MKRKLPIIDCKYGAAMGRRNNIPLDINTVGKLHLERLRWVSGDYDQGSVYWGGGQGDNIYWAYGETETEQVDIFVRARDRHEAKCLICDTIAEIPNVIALRTVDVKFYR